jgi:hypothetical protein
MRGSPGSMDNNRVSNVGCTVIVGVPARVGVGVLLGSIVAVAGSFVWVGGGIDVPVGLGGTGVCDGTAVQAGRQIAKITHAMIDLLILLPIRSSLRYQHSKDSGECQLENLTHMAIRSAGEENGRNQCIL